MMRSWHPMIIPVLAAHAATGVHCVHQDTDTTAKIVMECLYIYMYSLYSYTYFQ